MKRPSPLKIGEYYRLSWQLLLLVDCAVAIASRVARPAVILVCFTLAVMIVSSMAQRWQNQKRRIGLAIGASLLILVIQQGLKANRTEDFVMIMIELICGSLPWLLISYDRPRSYWLAILNIVVIGVGSMTLGSTGLVYIGFMILIILLMLNLNAANLYFSDTLQSQSGESLPKSYFRQFIYVIPVGFISALVIFLFFPRVQSFSFNLNNGRSGHSTGYSGLVNLTAEGKLEVSHDLAFMVESEDKLWLRTGANKLLFRGDTLTTFDGIHWRNHIFDFRPSDAAQDIRIAKEHDAEVTTALIHLEPSINASVFYPGVLMGISSPQNIATHFLINQAGSLIRDPFSTGRYTYQIKISQPLTVDQLETSTVSNLKQALDPIGHPLPYELAASDLAIYLSIPPSVAEAEYFQAWLRELAINPATATLADVEKKLGLLFSTKFKTTLTNSFSGTDALASFLATERRGHCEYFATAAALTLRALGLPARLVVGYHGGIFNEFVDTLEVRDEDAHAWVETYIPGHGWHAFDPTPASDDLISNAMSTLRLITNGINFWMHRYVINYDQSAQKDLIKQLQAIGRHGPENTPNFKSLIIFGESAASILVAAFLTFWLIRRWTKPMQEQKLPRYYQIFLKRMRIFGYDRLIGESFEHYHSRLVTLLGDEKMLEVINKAISHDLYSAQPRSAAEQNEMQRKVQTWRLPKPPSGS